MKIIIAIFITVSVLIACNKTDSVTPAPIPEESIQFSTNLDTGTYNIVDTLPLVVNVTSKLPASGLLYSITINWVDSAKQMFKLDTSINQSILNLKITGLNKVGNYSVAVSVSSKTNSSNKLLKTLSVFKNNFILYTTTIPLNISGFSKEDIATGIDGSVSGTIYDFVNGRERLVVSPTLFFRYPLLPSLNFTKNGGTWAL